MLHIERLFASVLLTLVVMGGLSGCSGSEDPNKGLNVKPTTRVTGKVLVDGEAPDTPVQIKAYPESSSAKDQPPASGATGEDGIFQLNTYNEGDGLPAGEYKLTFVWTEMRLGGATFGGGLSDKLGGQYADPKKTPLTVTVKESGDVVDLGVFELKKSSQPKKLPDDRK
jgi:hypothetical protein